MIKSDRQAQSDKFKKDYVVKVRRPCGNIKTHEILSYSVLSAINTILGMHSPQGSQVIGAFEKQEIRNLCQ